MYNKPTGCSTPAYGPPTHTNKQRYHGKWLKLFKMSLRVFCTVIIRCTETFRSPCIYVLNTTGTDKPDMLVCIQHLQYFVYIASWYRDRNWRPKFGLCLNPYTFYGITKFSELVIRSNDTPTILQTLWITSHSQLPQRPLPPKYITISVCSWRTWPVGKVPLQA
jgi:hypothetical protein